MRAAFGLVFALASLAALPGAAQDLASVSGPGTIEVVGRAHMSVAPDYAAVQVGVSTRAASAAAALDENSAAARRLTEAAGTFGIEPRDVRTSNVSLSPVYKSVRDSAGGSQQQVDGYQAENQVEIRVRDLARLGEFLRRSLDGGANRISGLGFGASDPRAATEEVRRAAVADAFRQGRLLADAAGVKLGAIRRMALPSGRTGGPPGPLYSASLRAAAAPVPVEPGQLEISAEIDMIWTIERP